MSNIDYIHELVDSTIKKFGTRDPFEICKCLHIRIHYKDLGTALKAYYFYQSRVKNIIINSRSEEIVRQILCAHELGHALLHGDLAAMRGFQELNLFNMLIPTEYEANLFAAELIISDEALLEQLSVPDKSFYNIAKELYVPAELLDFKFRVLRSKGLQIDAPCVTQSNFLRKDVPGCFKETSSSAR